MIIKDWDAGGTVSPLCSLENLVNAQVESTAKLMKGSGRTGESPLWEEC